MPICTIAQRIENGIGYNIAIEKSKAARKFGGSRVQMKVEGA